MTEIVYAIDVNSAWGKDLSGVIARHRPGHVVLHTYHGYEGREYAAIMRAQAASVAAAGRSIGMYAWAFRGYSPQRTITESVNLFHEATGHEPPVVWLDC